MPTVRISVDNSELERLEVDLSLAPARVQRAVPRVLKTRVGPKLEREMRDDARGHLGNWFGIPGTEYSTPLDRHVSHEMLGPFSVEAGIEYVGAGKLAHIIAYGSVNNGPAYDSTAALRRTTPFAVEWLADAAEESVLGDA